MKGRRRGRAPSQRDRILAKCLPSFDKRRELSATERKLLNSYAAENHGIYGLFGDEDEAPRKRRRT